ncbi:MAG: response regulator transcription factor [bacterium]|nr:response regulator transcription factor [bacterium]
MARVLVVEDEVNIARGLRFNLELEGHDVHVLHDGDQAREMLIARREPYDLLILDWMLPGLSGLDLCRGLRKHGLLMPVIMLTARDQSAHKIEGLMVGADDYVTKPFNIEELLARIETQLRRQRWHEQEPPSGKDQSLSFGQNVVDFERFEASHQGREVKLTSLEFQLLRYFAEHPGRVLSRQQLLEGAWGFSEAITLRTVDNFVLRLRKAFEDVPSKPRHFLSIRGAGYKFQP